MSESHHPGSVKGEVNNITTLSDNFASLWLLYDFSDVTLIVEGEEIPAHRIVLAARTHYFRALLYGGLKESGQSVIELKDTPVAAFKHLLRYIYSGRLNLSTLKEEMILDVLALANQFGLVELLSAISVYLQAVLSIRNVCLVFDIAHLYQLKQLTNVCYLFMDKNAPEILSTEGFLSLSVETLKDIISRDSFCVEEIKIFHAICEWVKHNPSADVKEVLSEVRLPLMSLQELVTEVRASGLLQGEEILDAIKQQLLTSDTELRYRGYLLPEENISSQKHGAQVLHGEMRMSLLDADKLNYDMEKGYTRHHIDDDNGQGIIIKLGSQYIINHVRLLLWDKDMRSYSYFIEVSMDQVSWFRVIDHTHYLCRSWQKLYFKPRVVRYLKLVGTHNSINRMFHAVAIECMYTLEEFKLDQGLLVPHFNVASLKAHACVIEGVSRSRDALLDGRTEHYDWDSGYTCHQLGSGAIVVQLAQPYVIDSMRLLLWDCDERTYSYFIETSVDQHSWTLVVDCRDQPCRSWQCLKFPPIPIVFIRIVGTQNTANEVFHCVHFECPAQEETQVVDKQQPAKISEIVEK